MSQLLEYRVRDLSGGRNTRDSDLALDGRHSSADLNLIMRKIGAIEKRSGTSRWVSGQAGTGPIMGLHRFYKSDGEKVLLIMGDHTLWEVRGDDSSGGKTKVSEGFYPCQPMNFATMNDWVYLTNYVDLVYRYDGNDFKASGLPAPSAPSTTGWTTPTGGRLGAGDYRYKFTAKYTGLGESNTSPATDAITAAADDKVEIDGLDAIRPTGAASIVVYRTDVNPPDPDAIRIYYQVGESATDTFTDTFNDVENLNQYEGDSEMPYNAGFITAHKNAMWYGYCMERDASDYYPSRVAISRLYEPDKLLGFIDVFPNDNDFITGIRVLNGNLIVFKRNHIYSIIGTPGTRSLGNLEVRSAHTDHGCVAPRSIAEVQNKLYFLSGDGVYAFDGARTHRVSDKIRTDLDALSKAQRFWAVGGSHRNRYLLSVEGA